MFNSLTAHQGGLLKMLQQKNTNFSKSHQAYIGSIYGLFQYLCTGTEAELKTLKEI